MSNEAAVPRNRMLAGRSGSYSKDEGVSVIDAICFGNGSSPSTSLFRWPYESSGCPCAFNRSWRRFSINLASRPNILKNRCGSPRRIHRISKFVPNLLDGFIDLAVSGFGFRKNRICAPRSLSIPPISGRGSPGFHVSIPRLSFASRKR